MLGPHTRLVGQIGDRLLLDEIHSTCLLPLAWASSYSALGAAKAAGRVVAMTTRLLSSEQVQQQRAAHGQQRSVDIFKVT